MIFGQGILKFRGILLFIRKIKHFYNQIIYCG